MEGRRSILPHSVVVVPPVVHHCLNNNRANRVHPVKSVADKDFSGVIVSRMALRSLALHNEFGSHGLHNARVWRSVDAELLSFSPERRLVYSEDQGCVLERTGFSKHPPDMLLLDRFKRDRIAYPEG